MTPKHWADIDELYHGERSGASNGIPSDRDVLHLAGIWALPSGFVIDSAKPV
jgi:hypothetical protein